MTRASALSNKRYLDTEHGARSFCQGFSVAPQGRLRFL